MSFGIFQNEKTLFQSLKNGSSNSQKIDIFPKGLTHGFGPKMAIFPSFFLRQYRPGKCLLRYPKTKKKPFQAIKTRKSKSRKIDIFPTFFGGGGAIEARKMSFTIFQNKKTPSQAIKTRSSNVEKLTFFQRGQPMVLVQNWPFFHFFFFGSIVDRWICRSMAQQIAGSVDRFIGTSLDLQIAGSVDR